MSASGAPFQPAVPISAAKANKKTVTQTSNFGIEPKLPGQIFIHEVNNGAYLKNDVTMWNMDQDGVVYLTQNKHLHDKDTHQAGGFLRDILAANIGQFLLYSKTLGLNPSDFLQEGTGGSTVQDSSSGAIKMDTSTTANNFRGMRLMGVRPGFNSFSVLQTKMQFTGNITAQFARWGMNLESMNLTNNSDSKYGIESCAATNGNWFLVTGDGSSRTQQDSLKPLLGGGTVQSYKIRYTPGVSVDFLYSTDAAVSKTTNLPLSSQPPPQNNVVNYGVKTTDANAKQLFVWGLVVVADENDPSWA